MASAVLRKYASIRVVDLIQQKKLDSWNFYESYLMEARFEFSMRVCYKVKVDIKIRTLSDTVDRENFAVKIISLSGPTVKI